VHFHEPKLTQEIHPNNGITYPALRLTAYYERGISPYEERTIKSIRGDILIKDRYGEVIHELSNIEYIPEYPITPGASNVREYGKSWTLYLINKPEVQGLREAISMRRTLTVSFRPTAVEYTDGTILR
jgi:hypothetical protein